MKEGQFSRTAEYMALFRALETLRPANQRVCDDPFAQAFLGRRLRLAVGVARIRPAAALIRAYIDRKWPGARTSGIARTRFIDDVADAALRSGVAQIVILGAGFDARAFRLPGMTGATVFEVDHPSTSAAKQETLGAVFPSPPGHVRLVAIDFNLQSLPAEMSAAGYDAGRRTLFIWEGVTNYLTEDAVDATLRWCAGAAAGTRIVFTYVHRQVLESPESFYGTRRLFATLRGASERWTFGMDPACVAAFLAERGLSLDEDIGASDYRSRYYGRAATRMQGYEFYRIAVAHVPEVIESVTTAQTI